MNAIHNTKHICWYFSFDTWTRCRTPTGKCWSFILVLYAWMMPKHKCCTDRSPFDTRIRISTPCIQNAHNSSWIQNMNDEQQSTQRNYTVTITTPKAAKFLLIARSMSYKSTENCSTPAILVLMQNQCTREFIPAWKSPTGTLTWHARKDKET